MTAVDTPTDRRSEVEAAELDLDRDTFLRQLLRELSGTLEEVVGLEEASGFVSVVGGAIGQQLDRAYREALDTDELTIDQIAEVLVDLKRRIQGDFSVIEVTEDRIVLGNRACPFAEKVVGRPSLCMMTSNVFGAITAENLGYAKVELSETIAEGADGCRVVVHLDRLGANDEPGREYYRTRHR